MAPYDSDSSDDDRDDQSFTQTNVTIGYPDKDSGGEDISRLGGRPEWLLPNSPASAALARCKICKQLMPLLLQLNGELPDRFPGHERRLYVFSCRRKACRRKEGSVRAVRGTKVNQVTEKKQEKEAAKEERRERDVSVARTPAPGMGESLFGVKGLGASGGNGGNANPFSTGGAGAVANPFSSGANPFSSAPKPATPAPAPSSPTPDTTTSLPATFAQTLSLNNPTPTSKPTLGPAAPPEPWPPTPDLPPAYPIHWIADAEYETLDPLPAPHTIPSASTAMDIDDAPGASSGKEDKDVFESSMDSTFQKFADRVGQNPEQVIRYEFGGAPLLYSKDDAVGKLLGEGKGKVGARGMPGCGRCGCERAFEVQMTPHAIVVLEEEEEGLDGMEWGTVIVGVCGADCTGGAGVGECDYVEEWAGVQWEEAGQ